MNHAEKAREYFLRGYNCAQSVTAAYCDLTRMSEAEALRLSSPFGGGMGRMREVCGALSGAFLVLGALYGYDDAENDGLKKALYRDVQSLSAKFKERHTTIVCRELLKTLAPSSDPSPTARTSEFYKARPCLVFVMDACELLDALITEKKLSK